MEYNPFSLQDKSILVTGASSGIGRAIAVECSRMGANVTITGRNEEKLRETFRNLAPDHKHSMVLADFHHEEEIVSLAEDLPGDLDGIVQCAGFTILKPFQFFTGQELAGLMKVNFESPVVLTQLLIKKKKISPFASIVFVSSVSGVYVSSVGGSIYSASKGALNGFFKGLAIELGARKIRVNCVNPGMIETEIFSSGVVSEEQLELDKRRYPLKRYGKPQEVAFGVIYLLSDASSWVTGSNLLIDGGYTLL